MRFVPDIPDTPAVWHICFVGGERKRLWHWVCARGYHHVFALGYLPVLDRWLCYDVHFWKTEISVLSGARAGSLLTWADREGGVLAFPALGIVEPRVRPRVGMWCVTAICQLLGLGCVAITPKGLHDYLKRRGATPLREEPA